MAELAPPPAGAGVPVMGSGDVDDRVHPDLALRLSSALLAAGRHHRLLLLEGGSHALLEHAVVVRREIEGWLERHLR